MKKQAFARLTILITLSFTLVACGKTTSVEVLKKEPAFNFSGFVQERYSVIGVLNKFGKQRSAAYSQIYISELSKKTSSAWMGLEPMAIASGPEINELLKAIETGGGKQYKSVTLHRLETLQKNQIRFISWAELFALDKDVTETTESRYVDKDGTISSMSMGSAELCDETTYTLYERSAQGKIFVYDVKEKKMAYIALSKAFISTKQKTEVNRVHEACGATKKSKSTLEVIGSIFSSSEKTAKGGGRRPLKHPSEEKAVRAFFNNFIEDSLRAEKRRS